MGDLAAGWGALCALVFVLGVRHGLDADHLAAIDGLTRVSQRQDRRHARYCGALFSLGHGLVVLSIALAAGALGAKGVPPRWFESLGSGISIGFLFLVGIVNLRAVLVAPAGAPVGLVGVRGRLVKRLLGRAEHATGPRAALGVGALFALSFDTLSQAALLAVMAVPYGGHLHALTLGLLFVLGMLVSDGANGWWIARLIGRTDRLAVVASRTMTLAVAGVSLLVAVLGTLRVASEGFDGWLAGRELAVGLGVVALIGLSYVVACRSAAPTPPAPAHPQPTGMRMTSR